ncbi:MAG: MlaE family ABC transporter permease [Alphaproteobacteria bacterium]
MLISKIRNIGRQTLESAANIGRIVLLAYQAVIGLRYVRPRIWLQQIIEVGFFSLPVIGLTAAFSGLVLLLQSYAGLAELGSQTLAQQTAPRVVLTALVQELGPVLAGLMLAGRVGAAMAAELGTMRVSEQIDALQTLSTDPISYLVTPRLLAATITLPILVLVANIIGILAAYLIATVSLNFSGEVYISTTRESYQLTDVAIGLLKAAVFGFLIALISSYQGYYANGGAAGVGRATRQAVVLSSISILAANYFITVRFFAA